MHNTSLFTYRGFHANCTINYTYINQFLSDPKDAESCLRHEFGAVIMDKGEVDSWPAGVVNCLASSTG